MSFPDASSEMPVKLPIHGFVLAGGKSARMGEDKALLRFRGKPMVEIAVEKLREFCAEVWIAGNREDLSGYAPVVNEARVDVGPAAGIEAGLMASKQPWALFVPVDVPLVPAELLRRWAEEVLHMDGAASQLSIEAESHPAFCMLRRNCLQSLSEAIDSGERGVGKLLQAIGERNGFDWVHDVGELSSYTAPDILTWWFANLNTPQDLAEAEAWARVQRMVRGRKGPGCMGCADSLGVLRLASR